MTHNVTPPFVLVYGYDLQATTACLGLKLKTLIMRLSWITSRAISILLTHHSSKPHYLMLPRTGYDVLSTDLISVPFTVMEGCLRLVKRYRQPRRARQDPVMAWRGLGDRTCRCARPPLVMGLKDT